MFQDPLLLVRQSAEVHLSNPESHSPSDVHHMDPPPFQSKASTSFDVLPLLAKDASDSPDTVGC